MGLTTHKLLGQDQTTLNQTTRKLQDKRHYLQYKDQKSWGRHPASVQARVRQPTSYQARDTSSTEQGGC